MQSPEVENPQKVDGVAKAPWQRVLALIAVGFCVVASPIDADTGKIAPRTPEAETADERDGWQFEMGAGFLLHSQGQTANVEVEWADPTRALSLSDGRVEPALAPGFTLEATVLTPALFSHKYAPRLFAHVGYEAVLEDSFATYRKFDSSATSDEPICNALPAVTIEVGGNPETGIPIPGSSSCDSKANIDTAIQDMWFLGVGAQVPVPIFEDRLKLRIGVDYLGQRWGSTKFSWSQSTTSKDCGSRNFANVFLDSALGTPALPQGVGCSLVTDPPHEGTVPGSNGHVTNKNEVNSTFSGAMTHALGVDVSALVDVYEWKALQLRLFLNTRFAWIINDLGEDHVIPSEYGTFKVSAHPDQFITQVGGGIRIYWTPRW